MTCVVLGGSRRISRLTSDVCLRLDRIIQQRFQVVVGDANGADKAFQKYLAEKGYRNVEVFCSGTSPRNNVGNWPCRNVATTENPGTFGFYAAKDQAMADVATVGFMLWDGLGVGTMVQVWRLLREQKSSLVYFQSGKQFYEVRSDQDWKQLLGMAEPEARATIGRRTTQEAPAKPELPLFGPDLHSVGLT